MNQKQIAELKKLAQKATPGPWVANTDGDGSLCEAKYPDGERHIIIEPAEWDNAAYIAAVNPQAILELIAENEQLNKEADWLARQIRIFESMWLDETDCWGNKPGTVSHWRKEAHKAVEESDAK